MWARQAALGRRVEPPSRPGGTLGEIIANNFSESIQTVRIAPTDRGFRTEGCGLWTRIGD